MKKTKFFMPLIAALALASCSSEDEPKNVNEEVDATSSYFSFSICNVNDATSSPAGVKSRADYEDGTGAEAKIDNVVLYFYNTDGTAINVNVGSTNTNYKIFKGTDLSIKKDEERITGTTDQFNVENWFEKTVELTLASKVDNQEVKVLAMVNARISENGDYVLNQLGNAIGANVSLTQMRDKAIFQGHYVEDNNLFVMSSSVYNDEDGNMHVAETAKIFANEEDAKKTENKAKIYVERIKARVNVIEKEKTTDNVFVPTIEASDLPTDVDATKLRIKVHGWALNTTANMAYFFKTLGIPEAWTGSVKWNNPSQHRSFWEIIPSGDDQSINTQFTPEKITTDPIEANKMYTNPNTSLTPTKVLVVTQLVDDTDNPVSIATWYGNNYKYDDLKIAIADYLKGSYYVENDISATEDGTEIQDKATSYRLISDKEIVLTQGSGSGDSKSWMTYISLDPNKKYYKGITSGQGGASMTFSPITYEEINTALNIKNLQGAKIWKNGYAYYFVDIKHLGGKTAVVRNHSYTIQIDGFVGLGTPIFNPSIEIPKPETPDDTDNKSYMNVSMNILSWRIVPVQNVTFGKK